jgi:hypothetical protein
MIYNLYSIAILAKKFNKNIDIVYKNAFEKVYQSAVKHVLKNS